MLSSFQEKIHDNRKLITDSNLSTVDLSSFLYFNAKCKHYEAKPGQAISFCVIFLKAKTNKAYI